MYGIWGDMLKKTFDDFPVGQRIRLCANRSDSKYWCCDFNVFLIGETGTVIENTHDYLGISVRMDNICIIGGDSWGFNPEHLEAILDKSAYGKDMVEM